ncbi:dihydrodipicolinate synthase family protein [Mesotoga prima]|uniref:dihydrodipicolinate synthase family protein n=1 Tax=Mesotoga prima TaxID=1184387 RepID=UPI001BD2673F|nr:dihydrodipicolinate synthase family protein [Mesotoga prima]HPI18512.1 dihydrodipicolinate synthase family protein [Mesotoga sp.]HQC14784.1 dihydrodipicolinate synthase family protein [Mesotoga prima]
MKAKDFVGIIPPVLSSFTSEGRVYEKGIREIIRFTLPHVNGYYPIGTYGCGPLMSIDERKRALEIILEEVNGKVPVVAHVGTADTQTTVELARHAKAAGAQGVGAISPYYSPHLPEDNLFAHFAALVDAVNEEDFPVYVYNNPHLSQNTITPSLLKRLAAHGLRGLKDSSFDLVNFYFFQDAVKDYPDFNVIIGTEAIFVGAFDAGATGCVCGMANIYPELLAEIYKAYMNGNREESQRLQRVILKIRQITKLGPTVPIMHAILRARGIDAGYSRSPYIDIDGSLLQKVIDSLKEIGLF